VPGPPGETEEERKTRKAHRAAREAVELRFAYVPPNAYAFNTREELRLAFTALGYKIDELMPDGSDKRLVLNSLEDLLPRAIRGVDRRLSYTPEMLAQLDEDSIHESPDDNQYMPRQAEPTPLPSPPTMTHKE
jgi:hypothetical protein